MRPMDERDRELLGAVQDDLPLISTPYAAVGQEVDMSEKEVLKRLDVLRRSGTIRAITAHLDPHAFDHESCLIAVRVPEEDLETIASRVSLHPGVTQNYQRNHALNLWFSLTLPRSSRFGIEETVRQLTDGADDALILRGATSYRDGRQDRVPPVMELTPALIEAAQLVCNDLPNVPRPFDALSRLNGTLTGDDLLAEARTLRDAGALRGIRAVVQPSTRGFAASPMAVWKAAEDGRETLARELSTSAAVLRSWVRAPQPSWDYSVYSTVVGRTVDECESIVAELAAQHDAHEYLLLFPLREFKTGRINPLGGEIAEWESRALRLDSAG